MIDGNGFVGTYLGLDAPGTVTVTLAAGGRGAPGCVRAAFVVGDARAPLELGPDDRDLRATFALAAGDALPASRGRRRARARVS